jgi:hypothetical protein
MAIHGALANEKTRESIQKFAAALNTGFARTGNRPLGLDRPATFIMGRRWSFFLQVEGRRNA